MHINPQGKGDRGQDGKSNPQNFNDRKRHTSLNKPAVLNPPSMRGPLHGAGDDKASRGFEHQMSRAISRQQERRGTQRILLQQSFNAS